MDYYNPNLMEQTEFYNNNLLANYFTTSMKSVALKYYPDLDLLALPSTIVRNGLKSNEKRTTLNNMDFMKIFDGVNENQTELKIGSITDSLLKITLNAMS